MPHPPNRPGKEQQLLRHARREALVIMVVWATRTRLERRLRLRPGLRPAPRSRPHPRHARLGLLERGAALGIWPCSSPPGSASSSWPMTTSAKTPKRGPGPCLTPRSSPRRPPLHARRLRRLHRRRLPPRRPRPPPAEEGRLPQGILPRRPRARRLGARPHLRRHLRQRRQLRRLPVAASTATAGSWRCGSAATWSAGWSARG